MTAEIYMEQSTGFVRSMIQKKVESLFLQGLPDTKTRLAMEQVFVTMLELYVGIRSGHYR